MKLSGKAKWILETAGEYVGRELSPDHGLGKKLLDFGRRVKDQGGGLSSRQVICLAAEMFESLVEPADAAMASAEGLGDD